MLYEKESKEVRSMKQKSTTFVMIAGIILVIAIVLSGCGGGGGGGYSSSGTPPTSTVQLVTCSTVTPDVKVSATDNVFTIDAVHAPVGGVVMWTNNSAINQHSVTSGSPPGTPDGMFDQTLNPSQSVCLKFTTPGTYKYYCKFHYTLGMTGSVTVP